MTTLAPVRDRIIVLPADKETLTPGGLVIPDAAAESPQRGTVVAAGSGRISDAGVVIPMEVTAGDTVVYGRYSGTELVVDGVTHLVMRESDIFAVVKES